MTTGEDQPQPVVRDAFVVPRPRVDRLLSQPPLELDERRVESRPMPQAVDGLESPGRYQPRPWASGDPVVRPLFHRRRERILHRFFGAIGIAQEIDERGEDAGGVRAIHLLDDLADTVLLGQHRTLDQPICSLVSANGPSVTDTFRLRIVCSASASLVSSIKTMRKYLTLPPRSNPYDTGYLRTPRRLERPIWTVWNDYRTNPRRQSMHQKTVTSIMLVAVLGAAWPVQVQAQDSKAQATV